MHASKKPSSDITTSTPPPQLHKALSRNKRIGLLWLLGPTCGVVAVMIIYAVVSFIANVIVGTSEDSSLLTLIVGALNFILGIAGTLCVIGIFIGIPLGIVFLTKKENVGSLETGSKLLPLSTIGRAVGAFSIIAIVFYFGLLTVMILIYRGIVSPGNGLSGYVAYLTQPMVSATLYLIFFIVFLRWLYSAYHNLTLLGHDTEMTAGWAVGNFFVPIVQLWRPYYVMRELYVKTTSAKSHWIVLIWWLPAIASLFLQDPILSVTGLLLFVSITLVLVATITRIQLGKYREVPLTTDAVESAITLSNSVAIIVIVLVAAIAWLGIASKDLNDQRIAAGLRVKAQWDEVQKQFTDSTTNPNIDSNRTQLAAIEDQYSKGTISKDVYILQLKTASAAELVALDLAQQKMVNCRSQISRLLSIEGLSSQERVVLDKDQQFLTELKSYYTALAAITSNDKDLAQFAINVGINTFFTGKLNATQTVEIGKLVTLHEQLSKDASAADQHFQQAVTSFNSDVQQLNGTLP